MPFIALTAIPSLLLSLYPTRVYRYLSQLISVRKQLAITAFAEALHNCFKDGLNGSRDYRALAGMFPLLILPYWCVLQMFDFLGFNQDLATVFFMLCSSLLISYTRPCKLTIANISLSFHCLLLATLAILYHIWHSVLSIKTETLEFLFIAILFLSHISVCIWALCKVLYHITIHS